MATYVIDIEHFPIKLTVAQLADLSVLLLQFLANFKRRHSPAQGLRKLTHDFSGGLLQSSYVVAKTIVLFFRSQTKIGELRFDGVLVALLFRF